MLYRIENIALLIKETRVSVHMTQHELALKSGVDASVILRIERGDTVPNIKTINRLVNALGYTPMVSFQKLDKGHF